MLEWLAANDWAAGLIAFLILVGFAMGGASMFSDVGKKIRDRYKK